MACRKQWTVIEILLLKWTIINCWKVTADNEQISCVSLDIGLENWARELANFLNGIM